MIASSGAGAGSPARRILAIALAGRGNATQAEAVFAEVTGEVREDWAREHHAKWIEAERGL